jgi:hypothetical protein
MKPHKSIMVAPEDWDDCCLCGARAEACHHVFGGPNRQISEREGFAVPLCNWCHNMSPNAVHFNRNLDRFLKRWAQMKYEQRGHSREDFVKLIGRNFL